MRAPLPQLQRSRCFILVRHVARIDSIHLASRSRLLVRSFRARLPAKQSGQAAAISPCHPPAAFPWTGLPFLDPTGYHNPRRS